MKLLYKPFSILFGVLAAKLGQALFRSIWAKIDVADPPGPEREHAPIGKIIAAQAIEAGVMAGTAAVADRAGMRTFQHLFGAWPGEKPEEAAAA